MGLRLKLGLYVVGFVSLVFVAIGAKTVRDDRRIYLQEMQKRGLTLLQGLRVPCAMALANGDIPTLDNYVNEYSKAATALDLEYLAVIDIHGRVVSHTATGEFGKVYSDEFTQLAMQSTEAVLRVPADDRDLLEVAMPVTSGLRWGTIKAAFTLKPLQATIRASTQRVIIFGVIAAIFAVLIAFAGLSVVVIRPIFGMREMARRIAANELEARVAIGTNDEMGELGDQLNRMAERIEEYTSSLESRVRERTQELHDANVKLIEANAQLERLAKTDPLTGLYNRRQFMESLEFEVRRGARNPHQFALIILDVDYFKSYNDTHGHTAGDELLQRLAALLQINLRATDVVARYGGEEFVVLLLDTGLDEGYATAKKLQQVVEQQPFPLEQTQPGGRATISVGVAFYPHDARDGRKLIEYADEALYASKESGRNRVTRWADLHPHA